MDISIMDTLNKNKKTSGLAKSSGQALVEVMVAVAILTVGFLGIVTLLSRALALNRVVADNYVATYLAAEGIEITKNIVDGNVIQKQTWNTGGGILNCSGGTRVGGCEVSWKEGVLRSYTGQPLDFDPNTNLYDYSGSATPTSFRRRITIDLVGQNELKVESTVSWTTRGGGTSDVTLEDHFYYWR
jgi:hypothetical protein